MTFDHLTARTHEPISTDCEEAEAEIRRLTEQLRIATELLEMFAGRRGQDMRYPGEHATLAEDALIRISVVD